MAKNCRARSGWCQLLRKLTEGVFNVVAIFPSQNVSLYTELKAPAVWITFGMPNLNFLIQELYLSMFRFDTKVYIWYQSSNSVQ